MAAIVCHQGSQSCLESQIIESRTLRLRLPSPKPLNPQPIDLSNNTCLFDPNSKIHCDEISNKNPTYTLQDNQISTNPNPNTVGLSFLQLLSNVSQSSKEASEKETSYVHPQSRRSSVILSPKSLELCTENLGNETGTDITENSTDFLYSSTSSSSSLSSFSSSSSSLYSFDGNFPTREQLKPCKFVEIKKEKKTKNFPPLLTTMRGPESLRMRPHREGGRLVIEAVRVPSSASCLRAERSNGRLRLCFLKKSTPSFDPQEEDDDDDESEGSEPINEGFGGEFESEMNGKRHQVVEELAEEDKLDEEEGEEEEDVEDGDLDECGGCEEGIIGNGLNFGAEMKIEKYERPSRCKEGGDHENKNNELLNWEPLWVATS